MNDFENPDDAQIRDLLRRVQRIAVVGLSDKPNRPSHGVAQSLQGFGYEVVPVNPAYDEVLGAASYADLADIGASIDLVDVFRAPEHVPEIVDRCIDLNMPALWLQEGVVDARAAARARDAGMVVVMDRCIYKEYRRLL